MKRLALLLACMVMLVSCGLKGATPMDQASIISEQATKTYFTMYNEYKHLEGILTGDNLKTLQKAAPMLNQAKGYLATYNDLVITWRIVGGEEPMDLLKNRQLINDLLAQISVIILGVM